MSRIRVVAILLAFIGLILSDQTAGALIIVGAKIDNGAVQVRGKKASPLATITWEGQAVTDASNTGVFKFATAILPQDCIGDLSDGVEMVPVVIQFCGPQGAAGAPGAVLHSFAVLDHADPDATATDANAHPNTQLAGRLR